MRPCEHQQTRSEPSLVPFIKRHVCQRCGRSTTRPGPGAKWRASENARRLAATLPHSPEEVQRVWDVALDLYQTDHEREEFVVGLLLWVAEQGLTSDALMMALDARGMTSTKGTE